MDKSQYTSLWEKARQWGQPFVKRSLEKEVTVLLANVFVYSLLYGLFGFLGEPFSIILRPMMIFGAAFYFIAAILLAMKWIDKTYK